MSKGSLGMRRLISTLCCPHRERQAARLPRADGGGPLPPGAVRESHEVHERLHDAIEPLNFAADDVHVAAGVRIQLRQFILQELKMKHDGIDRIFYLVSHAAGNATAGREAA